MTHEALESGFNKGSAKMTESNTKYDAQTVLAEILHIKGPLEKGMQQPL